MYRVFSDSVSMSDITKHEEKECNELVKEEIFFDTSYILCLLCEHVTCTYND